MQALLTRTEAQLLCQGVGGFSAAWVQAKFYQIGTDAEASWCEYSVPRSSTAAIWRCLQRFPAIATPISALQSDLRVELQEAQTRVERLATQFYADEVSHLNGKQGISSVRLHQASAATARFMFRNTRVLLSCMAAENPYSVHSEPVYAAWTLWRTCVEQLLPWRGGRRTGP